MPSTLVIADPSWGTHGKYIKQAILTAYPELPEANIYGWSELQNMEDVIDFYLVPRAGVVDAIIESTTTTIYNYAIADQLYKYTGYKTLCFSPMGGTINTHEEVAIFTENAPPCIVPSGAGDVGFEDRNNTSYGKGFEFWDNDLVADAGGDASSFSNGIILGKLLKIKDTLNCSWWEARFRARATADRNEPNRNNIDTIDGIHWCKENGFGIINVANAIAYTGDIPLDPYRRRIGDVGSLTLTRAEDYISIAYDEITNATSYEVQMETDGEWIDYTESTYTWTEKGTYKFRYRGKMVDPDNGNIEYSEWAEGTAVITMTPGTITVTNSNYTDNSITIQAIQDCSDYEIFRKVGGSNFIKLTTSGLTHTDADTVNFIYHYRYRGYNRYNNVYSEWSEEAVIRGMPLFQKLSIVVKEQI